MKIEISNSDDTYRLVDGEEDSESRVTGTIAEYGERSFLDETVDDPWWAEIDSNGESDGMAHTDSGKSEPVGFELDCEFEDEEEDEDEYQEEEPEAAAS